MHIYQIYSHLSDINSWHANQHAAQVSATSLTGEVVHTETVKCESGDCSNALMTFSSDVAHGIYMVNVMSNGSQWRKK